MHRRFTPLCILVIFVATCFASDGLAQTVRWSTWAAGVSPGEVVTVPAGATVLLDTDTPTLGGLFVRGTLRFEDARDLRLTSKFVVVEGPGALLEIGTEADPFQHRATITLVGQESLENVWTGMHQAGTKVLAVVAGGALELHGAAAAKRSWTQLGATARAGATSIRLAEPVTWEPGDRIALAPSGYSAWEAEELTVESVSSNGRRVTVSPALAHDHWGETQAYTHGDGRTIVVDQRAEVGLLSRNVVIEGDARSARYDSPGPWLHYGQGRTDYFPNTFYDPGFGGHAFFHMHDRVRIEGVEFRRMGQTGHAARYPVHWHHAGDSAGDYIRNSSIHHSFQRGVVTHQTGNVRVEDNVLYRILNHALIPGEDGLVNEKGNRYERNLVVLVVPPRTDDGTALNGGTDLAFPLFGNRDESSQDEKQASCLWTEQPTLTVRDNRCGGVTNGVGFFYGGEGGGPSTQISVDFEGNAAHSIGAYRPPNFDYPPDASGSGLLVRRAVLTGASAGQNWKDFEAYRCGVAGIWADGRERHRQTFQGAILADNGIGVFVERAGILKDALVVGASMHDVFGIGVDGAPVPNPGEVDPNRAGAVNTLKSHGGPKRVVLENVTVIDVVGGAFVVRRDLETGGDAGHAEDVTLVGSNGILFSYDEHYAHTRFLDQDGSLSGLGVPAMLYGYNAAPEPDWIYLDAAQGYADPVGSPPASLPPGAVRVADYAFYHGFEAEDTDYGVMVLGLGKTRGAWETGGSSGYSQGGGTVFGAAEAPGAGAPGSRRAIEVAHSGSGKSDVVLSRTLNLSGETGPLTLSFWIRLSDANRQSSLTLEAEAGGTTTVLGAAGPGQVGDRWYPVTVNLSAFAGTPALTLRWKATAMDGGEDRLWLDEVAVRRGTALASALNNLFGAPGDAGAVPAELELSKPYPNPSAGAVAAELALPDPAEVRVEVYDALGRLVAPAAAASYAPGRHRLPISAGELPAGTYFVRVHVDAGAEPQVLRHRFVLVR